MGNRARAAEIYAFVLVRAGKRVCGFFHIYTQTRNEQVYVEGIYELELEHAIYIRIISDVCSVQFTSLDLCALPAHARIAACMYIMLF